MDPLTMSNSLTKQHLAAMTKTILHCSSSLFWHCCCSELTAAVYRGMARPSLWWVTNLASTLDRLHWSRRTRPNALQLTTVNCCHILH